MRVDVEKSGDLTITQVAEYLGAHPSRVSRFIQSGHIDATKVRGIGRGGQHRIHVSSVLRFLAAQTVGRTAA